MKKSKSASSQPPDLEDLFNYDNNYEAEFDDSLPAQCNEDESKNPSLFFDHCCVDYRHDEDSPMYKKCRNAAVLETKMRKKSKEEKIRDIFANLTREEKMKMVQLYQNFMEKVFKVLPIEEQQELVEEDRKFWEAVDGGGSKQKSNRRRTRKRVRKQRRQTKKAK
jgi:hypothetical protein